MYSFRANVSLISPISLACSIIVATMTNALHAVSWSISGCSPGSPQSDALWQGGGRLVYRGHCLYTVSVLLLGSLPIIYCKCALIGWLVAPKGVEGPYTFLVAPRSVDPVFTQLSSCQCEMV